MTVTGDEDPETVKSESPNARKGIETEGRRVEIVRRVGQNPRMPERALKFPEHRPANTVGHRLSQNPRMPERALKRVGLGDALGFPSVRQNPRMPERALKPGVRTEKSPEDRRSESPNARKGIEIRGLPWSNLRVFRQNPRMPERALKSVRLDRGDQEIKPVRIPECPKGH